MTVRVLSILGAILMFSTTGVAAAPVVWLAGPAPAPIEPAQNLRPLYEGQAELRLLVVGRGFAGPAKRYHVTLRVLTRESTFPDVWRFDPGGCRSGGASVRTFDSDRRVPPLSGAHSFTSLVATLVESAPASHSVNLAFDALSDGILAHPESIYVLGEFRFDLAGVRAGVSTPDSCGCASQVVGLQIISAWVEDASGNPVFPSLGVDCAAWNSDGTSDVCFTPDCSPGPCEPQPSTCIGSSPTPTHAVSWGTIKDRYRARSR